MFVLVVILVLLRLVVGLHRARRRGPAPQAALQSVERRMATDPTASALQHSVWILRRDGR